MCAVDTGWITDENPAPKKERIARAGFRTPLDIVDGAARIYDPIVRGEAGHPVSGVFLEGLPGGGVVSGDGAAARGGVCGGRPPAPSPRDGARARGRRPLPIQQAHPRRHRASP